MAFPTNHPSLHQPHYPYIHPSIDPGLVCVKEKAMIALQRKCIENFHNNNFSRFIFCMQKLLLVKQSTVVKIYFSQIFPRFFPDFPEQRDQKKSSFSRCCQFGKCPPVSSRLVSFKTSLGTQTSTISTDLSNLNMPELIFRWAVLWTLTEQIIDKSWPNLSLNSFKVKCKNLFLNWQ